MFVPRALALILLLTLIQESSAQQRYHAVVAGLLDFEGEQTGGMPRDWAGSPPSTIFTDNKIVHSGKWALRLERHAGAPEPFSSIGTALPIDFSGQQVQLRGFLKSENVDGSFGLWMRQDINGSPVEFDNLSSRRLRGTTDWTEYSITLPLHAGARLIFGVLLSGRGKVWADDLQLLVDGQPIALVPINGSR